MEIMTKHGVVTFWTVCKARFPTKNISFYIVLKCIRSAEK